MLHPNVTSVYMLHLNATSVYIKKLPAKHGHLGFLF